MEDKGLRDTIHKLFRDFKIYFDLKWEYLKLDIIETLVTLYTKVFSIFLAWLIIPVFLFFMLIGLALYLGSVVWDGKLYLGFFAVGGGILVLGILAFLLRKLIITNPLVEALSESMLDTDKYKTTKRGKYAAKKTSKNTNKKS